MVKKKYNHIGAFIHCRKCLDKIPEGQNPRDYASLEVGWTKKGLQIWCKRHECNVLALDFRKQKIGFDPVDKPMKEPKGCKKEKSECN